MSPKVDTAEELSRTLRAGKITLTFVDFVMSYKVICSAKRFSTELKRKTETSFVSIFAYIRSHGY